jgi:outer membrane protein TolC
MKKIYLILLALVFLMFSIPLCAFSEVVNGPSRVLSLKEAIGVAFLSNKDIQIQEEEIASARANITDAQGKFLPTLDATASYTYYGTMFTIPSAVAPNLKKDIGIFNGYQNDNKLGLSVNETVFNGGANIVNMKQARLGLKIQEQTLRARKFDVEFETKRLYYGLLFAYETERITKNLLEQAQAHYEDVKNKFDQGTSSKFDVLQSKVQVSKVMPELIKAQNDIDLIKADLKKLLSLKMTEDVGLKDDKLTCSYIEIKEDEFLKEAYATNPQVILKMMGVDMNKWGIEYAKAGYGPFINANFDYMYRSNSVNTIFEYKHTNWNAGASVTIPIFDAFSTKAKVDEAKAKYAQAGLEKENINDQVAVDIKKACLDMREAKQIIDYEKDSIEEAKEALRIANIGYDNGVKTNLDVLDSQVSLSQVERSYVEGIYDYLMARAFLDKTTGRAFYKEENNGSKT